MTFYRPHNRVTLNTGDFTHTKQNHKAECDINNIIKQYQKTGIINHISRSSAQYLDLPSSVDFQDALNTVISAEDAFNQLPAKLRDRFGNDPAQLLMAIQNPQLREELESFGLFRPKANTTGSDPADPKTASQATAAGSGSPQP